MQTCICISQSHCFLFSNCRQERHAWVKFPKSQIIQHLPKNAEWTVFLQINKSRTSDADIEAVSTLGLERCVWAGLINHGHLVI